MTLTVPASCDSARRPLVLGEFFTRAAARWPDAVAVDVPPGRGRPERTAVSYAELDHRSDRIAQAVFATAGFEGIAAILLPRSTEQLYAAQLGVLKSTSAYACVDPVFPDEQLRHVLDDSGAGTLLTDAEGARRAVRVGYAGEIIRVDRPLPDTGEWSLPSPSPDSLAYIIYTSGTTGRPKGVMITHRGIVNLVGYDLAEFRLGPGDRVAQNSSSAYDSSVEEVWLALASGATLVPMDDDTVRLGPDLVPWLRDERITVFCPPPTLLRTTGCADPRHELPDLRQVNVGGEALTEDIAALWAPGRRLVNDYGPTECTVTCVRQDIVAGQPIAIGRPVHGMHAWILDENLEPVPDGEKGELCFSGPGLAVGYRNQPELTAEKFPTHPRLGRIYRTGDLAHRDANGVLFYHGRIDSQVKLRGYRVELEAIEARLVRCPGIREAACRVEGSAAAQVLTAHVVVADPARPPDADQLKAALRLSLPWYMVPAFIGVIDQLPRTTSGKVHRAALPALATGHQERRSRLRAPSSHLETTIVAALRRALTPPGPVGVDDDFFDDLGGSSLQAAMLISELRRDPATANLTVRDVYDTRTAARLALRAAPDRQRPPTAGRRTRLREVTGGGNADEPAARPRRRPVAVTVAQSTWLLLELLVAAPLAYLTVFTVAPWVAGLAGLTVVLLVWPIVAAAARPVITPLSIWAAAGAKKLLIGRYRPTRVPVWSGLYLRHWLVRQFVRLVPWGTIAGTELQCVALRALGARIGQRVHIHRGVDLTRGGWDLLSIGDDVTIGQDASIRLVELTEGDLVVGPVTLADGATLEPRAGVGPYTRVGRNSTLTALSSLPTGGGTGDDEIWDGVPARPVAPAEPLPPLTERGRELSPMAHGVATIMLRSAISAVLALPFSALAVVAVAVLGIRYADVLLALAHPVAYLPLFAGLGVLACVSLAADLALDALIVRALGTVRAGVISRWSPAYIRVWLKSAMVNAAGTWLNGTLFWPVWLRAAGMKVGRGSEISTIIDVIPELVEIGPETFFADGIYLGGPKLRRGTVTLAPVRLGRNTFLGNHAVVPAGQNLPPDILIGICTVADDRAVRPGTSWFGHPAFELPRREVVACDRSLTHDPSPVRRINRLFWECLRFVLPVVPLTALVAWAWAASVATTAMPYPVALAVAAPVVTLAATGALCSFVLALKWVLLGRVRPGTHPLWSCWQSRWDFLYVAWDFVAARLVASLEGTLLLAVWLRATGMKIGKRVVFGDGFAHVVDPDMLEIGDGATVHAIFQAHTFEDRVLKIDHIRVGAHATLAGGTVPLYGADIGGGTYVAPHSVVMKHEHLRPHTRYEGAPTAEQDGRPEDSAVVAHDSSAA